MKKYRAIFCGAEQHIRYVYSEKHFDQIREITDLMPEILTPSNFDSLDLSGVEVIFSTWGMMNFTEEQLEKMPSLKAVFYAAGATDYFARSLFKKNIKVVSAWIANAIPVAEFTVAQIILSMKNYFSNSWSNRVTGPGNYGETVALLGAGAISSKVKELLQNFHLNVITVPSRKEKRTISLEEAFKTAYVISNHLPDREDNKKVITREMFLSMRKGATFINTGRGAQIDEEGMCEVLALRPDLTALLDVTYPEPPAENSPLYTLKNVKMTSHIAGSVNDEVFRMSEYMIEEYKKFANDEPLSFEVKEEMLLTH